MNKKKWISILLCLALVFTCITPVFADSNAWNGEDFSYDSAGTTITGLSDLGKEKIKVNPDLVLPAEGPGGAIVALGEGANGKGIFVYEDGGKLYTPANVTLPSTLKVIGKWAFALDGLSTYEAKMTSIKLPEGLVEIGQTAFQNSELTSIVIPDSVTTIGMAAFTNNKSLANIKLSKNADIPTSAFANAPVKTLVIPEGVKNIGKQAFDSTYIENVVLPETLVTIGEKAFHNNQLTKVVIPGSVTEIGKSAFKFASTGKQPKLTEVVLNEGLVKIGQEAFMGNIITEVNLPTTVELSVKNKAADNIFGKKNSSASPLVVFKTSSQTQVNAYIGKSPDQAEKYSHTVVYDANAKAITAVKDDAALASAKVTYTGSELKPAVTITGLVEGTDFEVTYRDNVEVGTATAEVVGKGDYYGSFRLAFEIEAAPAPAPTPTPSVPVTGDTAPMALMVALMAVAAVGGFVAYRKRNN